MPTPATAAPAASPTAGPTVPADRVATRVVVAALGIDLPVIRPGSDAEYPLWLTLKDHVPGLRLEHVNARGAAATPAEWTAYRDFVPDVVLRILASDPDQRQPVQPRLTVGKQAYALGFQNERLAVYEAEVDSPR